MRVVIVGIIENITTNVKHKYRCCFSLKLLIDWFMNGINTYNIAYVVPNQYAFCVIANIEFIIPLNVNGIILKQVKIMYIDVE